MRRSIFVEKTVAFFLPLATSAGVSKDSDKAGLEEKSPGHPRLPSRFRPSKRNPDVPKSTLPILERINLFDEVET